MMNSNNYTIYEAIEIIVDSFLNDENTVKCIKTETENDFAAKSNTFLLGGGLAMKIRNGFNLWDENSDIVKEFNEIGMTHPDEMSDYILRKAYRKIKNYE